MMSWKPSWKFIGLPSQPGFAFRKGSIRWLSGKHDWRCIALPLLGHSFNTRASRLLNTDRHTRRSNYSDVRNMVGVIMRFIPSFIFVQNRDTAGQERYKVGCSVFEFLIFCLSICFSLVSGMLIISRLIAFWTYFYFTAGANVLP